MISYSVGYTAIDAAGTTVTVTPPPAYAAGDLLVMGIIAGGTSPTVVTATTPSGWTKQSGSSAPGVFTKTATSSEPGSYTVTVSATSTIAVFIAAYPAATVASSAFRASGGDVVTYSPAFPSGVTSGQTVLLVAAAVASATDVNRNSGYQNVNLPATAGWSTSVPVFGQALPDNTSAVYPAALGLAEITGSTSAPVLASGQGCAIYAGYLVLNITGTASPLSVTATVAPPEGIPGLALTVKVLSGAQTAAAIASGGAKAAFYAAGTSQAPQATLTPNASGSTVYGAVSQDFSVTAGQSFTANTASTFSQNTTATSLASFILGTFQSSGTTAAGTAVTLGGSAPANGYTTAALAEILAAPGAALAETATATAAGTLPGHYATTAAAQTAVFRTPPASGTLLVAMVAANSSWGSGNAAVTLSDSSGLTWTPLAEKYYPSYSGVWAAGYGGGPGSGGITDEAGAPVLDEGGSGVSDETGAGSLTTVTGVTGQVTAAAPAGTVTAPGPVTVTGTAGKVSATAPAGFIPGPVAVAGVAARALARALAGTVTAGTGTSGQIQDEAGGPLLDESGANILDESGGGSGPTPPPVLTGTWTAARAGFPGDGSAENAAEQVSQFLVTHTVTPVRAAARTWAPAAATGTLVAAFEWAQDSGSAALLPAADIAQPFTLPAGVTAVGRAAVALQAAGNGTDLTVSLCPDNGSGSPDTTRVLASAVLPASHTAALSASGSLASAGPLQVSRYNASLLGIWFSQPWAVPAVSASGPGLDACPVSDGGYTVFLGGQTAAAAVVTNVSVVTYQGTGQVSAPAAAPPLLQAAYGMSAALTDDTVVTAGGWTGAAYTSGVWTASWDGAGNVGAWSSQTALPAVCAAGAMASSGEYVYVSSGTPDGSNASATGAFWWTSVSGGSLSQWNTGPRLPKAASHVYLACVGNYLVCAGGVDTTGAALSTTWIAELGADGTPGAWTAGPPLPVPVYCAVPGWNLLATDSAVIIVSGPTTGAATSAVAQSLSVSADGPAPEWQLQDYSFVAPGNYQLAAYPDGAGGDWQGVAFQGGTYQAAVIYPVPVMSVPLPASGLTAGGTYHLVLHSAAGTAADYLDAGLLTAGGTPVLSRARGSSGTWAPAPGLQAAAVVYDQTPAGALMHLYEDAGSRVTTLARDSTGRLTGILDATVFPEGSPSPVLSAVTEVQWSGGQPSALAQLA